MTESPRQASYWRIALLLAIVAALWDAYWLATGILVARQSPLSVIETGLYEIIAAAHAVSLAAFFLPRDPWLGATLACYAVATAGAGFFYFYFYVVWPGASLLLASSAFGLLIRRPRSPR